ENSALLRKLAEAERWWQRDRPNDHSNQVVTNQRQAHASGQAELLANHDPPQVLLRPPRSLDHQDGKESQTLLNVDDASVQLQGKSGWHQFALPPQPPVPVQDQVPFDSSSLAGADTTFQLQSDPRLGHQFPFKIKSPLNPLP
ncbi:hypothetical protein BT69DRAFT_1359090, partial [Atractiella rhizophila]